MRAVSERVSPERGSPEHCEGKVAAKQFSKRAAATFGLIWEKLLRSGGLFLVVRRDLTYPIQLNTFSLKSPVTFPKLNRFGDLTLQTRTGIIF